MRPVNRRPRPKPGQKRETKMEMTLKSIKGSKTVSVESIDDAVVLATEMQDELQSAYGVDVCDMDGAVLEHVD